MVFFINIVFNEEIDIKQSTQLPGCSVLYFGLYQIVHSVDIVDLICNIINRGAYTEVLLQHIVDKDALLNASTIREHQAVIVLIAVDIDVCCNVNNLTGFLGDFDVEINMWLDVLVNFSRRDGRVLIQSFQLFAGSSKTAQNLNVCIRACFRDEQVAGIAEVIDMVPCHVHTQPFSTEITEQADNEPGAMRDVGIDTTWYTQCGLRLFIQAMEHRVFILICIGVTVQIGHSNEYI